MTVFCIWLDFRLDFSLPSFRVSAYRLVGIVSRETIYDHFKGPDPFAKQ